MDIGCVCISDHRAMSGWSSIEHIGLRKHGWHFGENILKCIFLNVNVINYMYHEIFAEVWLTKIHHFVQVMVWQQTNNKPLSESMDNGGLIYWHLYQCCPKTVVLTPCKTHKWNGQPIVAPRIVCFATDEFPNDLSPFVNCVQFGKQRLMINMIKEWVNHIIYRSPEGNADQPVIQHGWFIVWPRINISNIGQHWYIYICASSSQWVNHIENWDIF